MFWAFLDIITLEAAEIILPQNGWIQLSSDGVSHSRRMKSSTLKSVCILAKVKKLHTSVSVINLVNIIAIITIVAMV
jgi:hypothetical protein